MKGRFTTVDIIAACVELNAKFQGLRVYNIYDCDHKTYLIRLVGPDTKALLLLESGIRIHSTTHDWPKSASPSGFTMKLRKHLRGRRFEHVHVLGGIDRIVDLQFGSGEAAYHIILELYDIGNIVLTDYSYTILNILRRRTDKETTARFFNQEQYPVHLARQKSLAYTEVANIEHALNSISDTKQQLKRALAGAELSPYGVALLQHCLIRAGMNPNEKLKTFVESESVKPNVSAEIEDAGEANAALAVTRTYREGFIEDLRKVFLIAEECILMLSQSVSKGYITLCEAPPIISKRVKNKKMKDEVDEVIAVIPDQGETEAPKQMFDEFHPVLFDQLSDKPHRVFDSFLMCVDTFYSEAEEQRLTNKIAVQQRQATDKLLTVRRDHEARLRGLRSVQEKGVRRAELIALNRELVDDAIEFLNNLVAVGMSWSQIDEFVQIEQTEGDPVACRILRLDLEHNSAIIVLNDPFAGEGNDPDVDGDTTESDVSSSEEEEEHSDAESQGDAKLKSSHKKLNEVKTATNDDDWVDVTIDLQMNAFQNMQKLHNDKRTALKKEEKTLQSSEVALRNAERKAVEAMKTVSKIQNIHKTRKTFWFEKFQWFLSSDGILVIAGRDRQQNELIVKRHLSERDLYVHAELHGASSIVIKNVLKIAAIADADAAATLPPRTLREAGVFAACLSHAWNENVSTRVWWVYCHQVSKTAPTGEFLPTGSFMIRGRKNFLPLEPMVMGFGFLFRLDDVSTERRLKLQQQNAASDAVAADSVNDKSVVDAAKAPSRNGHNASAEVDSDTAEFPDIQLNAGSVATNVDANDAAKNENMYDIVDKTVSSTAQPALAARQKLATKTKQQQRSQKKQSVGNVLDKSHVVPTKVSEKVNITTNTDDTLAGSGDISTQQQAKRGAKNKKRMQRKKYADQDEEERLLRTKLYKSKEQAHELITASNAGRPILEKSEGAEQISSVVEESAENVNDNSANADGEAGAETKATVEKDSSDENEDPDVVTASEVPAGAIAADDFDDNLVELNEENFVQGVCADPTPEDSLLWCIPVCSPYTSLTNGKYKYKVKLIPAAAQANSANMKRSKVVKSAVAVMTQQKDATELEKELIKAVKEQDLYKNIIGNAKIGLAAQLIKKATTKGKKKTKKTAFSADT